MFFPVRLACFKLLASLCNRCHLWIQSILARTAKFAFRDRWSVEGELNDVAAFLSTTENLPHWWRQFRAIEILTAGTGHGSGRSFQASVKGFLPYTLNLVYTVDFVRFPDEFSVSIGGDLCGRGGARLTQYGDRVLIEFHVELNVARPALRRLSPLLRPLMYWQHRYAMDRGGMALSRALLDSLAMSA